MEIIIGLPQFVSIRVIRGQASPCSSQPREPHTLPPHLLSLRSSEKTASSLRSAAVVQKSHPRPSPLSLLFAQLPPVHRFSVILLPGIRVFRGLSILHRRHLRHLWLAVNSEPRPPHVGSYKGSTAQGSIRVHSLPALRSSLLRRRVHSRLNLTGADS